VKGRSSEAGEVLDVRNAGAMTRLTVPGNLLLLGEYAVTEEGGLGLALAVDRRVLVEVQPSPALIVEGRWGEAAVRWSDESARASPLISGIVETWREQLYAEGIRSSGEQAPKAGSHREPAARIVLDSSAFFTGGRKSGFGSSAAVTVALSCALLHLSGFSGPRLLQCAARLALLAHRRVQGGRGSGYDVYASLYGGIGSLVGGTEPSWQAVRLPWLPPLHLFAGPASVSTASSLRHYERWKSGDPAGWRSFLEESNRNVRRFLQAKDWFQAIQAFSASRELGLRLGERIGVSAAIEAPDSLDPGLCKALGAGNELGIYLGEAPAHTPDLEAVALAPEGVRWLS
jgi:phosphomevalonate kinase